MENLLADHQDEKTNKAICEEEADSTSEVDIQLEAETDPGTKEVETPQPKHGANEHPAGNPPRTVSTSYSLRKNARPSSNYKLIDSQVTEARD